MEPQALKIAHRSRGRDLDLSASDGMVTQEGSESHRPGDGVGSAHLLDQGAPSYDARNATALADLGIPAFACTPELFPGLMAAAIQKQDMALWAARNGIVAARAPE